jgi:hypothetical protein
MKKLIAISAALFIAMFIASTAHADSLSTEKIIFITLEVISQPPIGSGNQTILRRTIERVDKEAAFDIVYYGINPNK